MKNKLGASALKAYSIYVPIMTAMVIVTEFSPAFKNFLVAVGGHHWTGKGIIGTLLFVILTLIFNAKGSDADLGKNIKLAMISAIAGTIVIFLFFIVE